MKNKGKPRSSKPRPKGSRSQKNDSRRSGSRQSGARSPSSRQTGSRSSSSRHAGSQAQDMRHRVVGPRFVQEAIRGGTIDTLHVEARLERSFADLMEQARAAGIKVRVSSSLDEIADDLRHQGVLGEGESFPFVDVSSFETLESPLLLALDQVTDPHNFGAILRSAMVFGVDGVIIPKHGSARVTPVVVRSSAGASERIPIAQVTNLQRTLDDLAAQGREVVGLAPDGEHSVEGLTRVGGGRVLVAGSEGSGLRRLVRERCTYCVRIPQLGDFDSLNVSVATAIVLYEASRAR